MKLHQRVEMKADVHTFKEIASHPILNPKTRDPEQQS